MNFPDMFKSHHRYFQIAKEEAEDFSDFGRIKIGSIVVYKHSVIGMGSNTLKTAPAQRVYNKFRGDQSPEIHRLHAEMQAISRARRNRSSLKGAKLFVYRELNVGNWLCVDHAQLACKPLKMLELRKFIIQQLMDFVRRRCWYEIPRNCTMA